MRFPSRILLLTLLVMLIGCASAVEVTTPPVADAIYINEVLAHTDLPLVDAIELFNPTTADVNISGWFLSDKADNPKRVRLPAGTVVPANGYLVLDESVMRSGDDGFGLSESGETVYLSAADAVGELTGFVTEANFAASPNGVSFGRIQSDYVLLTHLTLGSANAPPQIGPIVIQEIFATTSPTLTQYIRFENITDDTVPLYDPQNPNNVWRIRKTVDYDFPPFTTIAPNEQFIVAADPTAFAAQTDLRIFGPFSDQLDPTGSTIDLRRPDTPNEGKVPFITIDYVNFTNDEPWVEATQLQALRRISAKNYGNDSVNWALTTPRQQ